MNMNHIINMIIRQVMNRVIRKGVDTGMSAKSNLMAKRKKSNHHWVKSMITAIRRTVVHAANLN